MYLTQQNQIIGLNKCYSGLSGIDSRRAMLAGMTILEGLLKKAD